MNRSYGGALLLGVRSETGCRLLLWGFWAGVETEDGYMWLLGAVDSEAPNCYEGDSTNHPEEWDDFILWLGPGLTTAEDDCRSPRS